MLKLQEFSLSKGELPALNSLIGLLNLHPYLSGEVILEGRDPVLASPHKLGEAVATTLLLDAIAASAIWKFRTGQDNDLYIHIHDAIHFLHHTHFVWQSGYIMTLGADLVPLNYHFKCKDNRQVWLQCGPPYLKLQNHYLNFFDCGNNRHSLAKTIAQWNSSDLEEKMAELGLPCCIVRTSQEWRAHPQGKLLMDTPVIEIEKIAEGKPYGLGKGAKSPLEGIKVADLTHVLAGPTSTMCLAQFGATVLHIAPPHHNDPKSVNLGVNRGKKSAFADLSHPEDQEKLKILLKEADVFAQSYRPSVMEKFSLDVKTVTALNPNGMIYLSINAFGHTGPWKYRPGFDQNAQMACGFSTTEGSLENPQPSPVFYTNDLLTAYLAAAGMMTALLRRATEGGSYHVKVSLAKSCMWAQDLGLIKPEEYQKMPEKDRYPERFNEDLAAYTYLPKFKHENSSYGSLKVLAPAVKFSQMPEIQTLPVVPYGLSKLKF